MDSEKTLNDKINHHHQKFTSFNNKELSEDLVNNGNKESFVDKNQNSINLIMSSRNGNVNNVNGSDSNDLKESLKFKMQENQNQNQAKTNISGGSSIGNGSSSMTTANSSNGQKMGSRRIFTPQFKLQVLESYRNDNDCKGNQRATARKYGIHRRQIQKWLQCESTLRSSVANINQNNVKHQFHNLSHHQQQQQQQTHRQQLVQQASTPLSSSSNVNNIFAPHHLHHPQTLHHLSMDSKILNSTQHSSPHLSESSSSGKDVMATNNLAAVVAAAASSVSSKAKVSSMSPLRPTAINSAVLHPHHASYPLPYTHAPIPLAVLPSHISSHHHMHHHSPHFAYHEMTAQLHNSLTHQAAAAAAFVSSPHHPVLAGLPDLQATSRTNPSLSCHDIFTYKNSPAAYASSLMALPNKSQEKSEENDTYRRESQSSTAHHSDSYLAPLHIERPDVQTYIRDVSYNMHIASPIDLSLGCRRDLENDQTYLSTESTKTESPSLPISYEQNMSSSSSTSAANKKHIVDLTYKKRKACNDFDQNNEEVPEKLSKSDDPVEEKFSAKDHEEKSSAKKPEENNNEKAAAASKPQPKLFKPYLLDNENEDQSKSSILENNNATNHHHHHHHQQTQHHSPHSDSIIWSNYKLCLSPKQYELNEDLSSSLNFQCPSLDKYRFHLGSPTSQDRNSESPISLNSPIHLRCPKGSPVSGYESSSSTYSESNESFTFNENHNKNFSFRLSMKSVKDITTISDGHKNHYRRWLDQDINNATYPPINNSSIAVPA